MINLLNNAGTADSNEVTSLRRDVTALVTAVAARQLLASLLFLD